MYGNGVVPICYRIFLLFRPKTIFALYNQDSSLFHTHLASQTIHQGLKILALQTKPNQIEVEDLKLQTK